MATDTSLARPLHTDRLASLNHDRSNIAQNVSRCSNGKLRLSGPIWAIYLFDVKTVEEARELTAKDPAIKAGSLVMELHPWYGSAALLRVSDIHKRVAKDSF